MLTQGFEINQNILIKATEFSSIINKPSVQYCRDILQFLGIKKNLLNSSDRDVMSRWVFFSP